MSIRQSFINLCSVLKDKFSAINTRFTTIENDLNTETTGIKDRLTQAETDITDLDAAVVKHNVAQHLTDEQKATARANIGVTSADEQTKYKLVKESTAEDGYSATYKMYVSEDNGSTYAVDSASAAINIPKDLVVESGSVKTCTEADKPVAGYKVGDTYIDLVLANTDDEHVYIKTTDLVDIYTAEQGATSVQLTVSDDNVISAVIVDGAVSEAKLAADAVTTAKIKDGNVTRAKIDAAFEADIAALEEAVDDTITTTEFEGYLSETSGS